MTRRTLTQQELLARAMSEKELTKYILQLANALGWTSFHARDSRKQQLEGLPDLLLVRPPRLEWWELKRETVRGARSGRLSLVQEDVIEMLQDSGQVVRIVRPSDYMEGRVAGWLR